MIAYEKELSEQLNSRITNQKRPKISTSMEIKSISDGLAEIELKLGRDCGHGENPSERFGGVLM